MNSEKQELLQKFLDGELRPEEERDALHHIADNSELRELLRLELQMHEHLEADTRPDVSAFHVPEGFKEQVMADIAGSETEQSTWQSDLKSWLAGLLEPKPVTIRPAWATAGTTVMLLMLALTVYYWPMQPTQEQLPARTITEEQDDRFWMRFVYVAEDAESVAVAGDFSEWEEIPLTKNTVDGDVVWTGTVPLTRGEYRYMFVKDGEQWVTDPLADSYREDGFGNKNAVIKL